MKKVTQKQMKSESPLLQQNQQACEKEVGRRAYQIWEASGFQHGNDMAHWLAAENEISARRPETRDEP
jgi:hypothetical protein